MTGPQPPFLLLGEFAAPGIEALKPQARALLAYLLLHPHQPHNAGALADGLRVNRVPPTRSGVRTRADNELVQTNIRLIREMLKEQPQLNAAIETTRGDRAHYCMRVDPELLDTTHFRRLVQEAQAVVGGGAKETQLALWRRALALWHGREALHGLSHFELVAGSAKHLNNARTPAVAHRLRLELELKGPDAVLGLLPELGNDDMSYPQTVGSLMRAYHRRDQNGAALECYDHYYMAAMNAGWPIDPELVQLKKEIQGDAEPPETPLLAEEPIRGFAEPSARPSAVSEVEWGFPADSDAAVSETSPARPTLDRRLRYPEPGPTPAPATPVVIEKVLANLRLWTESDALLGLVERWSPPAGLPSASSYRERFEELEEATEGWNSRNYTRQRWAQWASQFGADLENQIVEASDQLGMRNYTAPAHGSYELAVALGGARRAPLSRTKWLELVAERYEIGAFAFTASLRPLDERAERPHTTYAPAARTEFDLMHEAALLAPGLSGTGKPWSDDESELAADPHVWAASGLRRTYAPSPNSPPLYGFAAPSNDPRQHRPRTPDALRYLYKALGPDGEGILSPGARVLFVTSAIYVPYQQIEALRVLGLAHGLRVETIGHPRQWTVAAYAGETPSYQVAIEYLQAMRSAVEACRRLAIEFAPHMRIPEVESPNQTSAPS